MYTCMYEKLVVLGTVVKLQVDTALTTQVWTYVHIQINYSPIYIYIYIYIHVCYTWILCMSPIPCECIEKTYSVSVSSCDR